MLEVGKKAPDFELPDQNGEMHKLSDYAGKKVILYFYPKDNTSIYYFSTPAFFIVFFYLTNHIRLSLHLYHSSFVISSPQIVWFHGF